MEHSLRPGDLCPECQQLGLSKHLRYFHISLHEQIVKCESDSCIYPFLDDLSADEEEKPDECKSQIKAEIAHLDNSNNDLAFIEGLLKESPSSPNDYKIDFVCNKTDLVAQINVSLPVDAGCSNQVQEPVKTIANPTPPSTPKAVISRYRKKVNLTPTRKPSTASVPEPTHGQPPGLYELFNLLQNKSNESGCAVPAHEGAAC